MLHFNIIQVAIMLIYYFHKNKRKCLRNCFYSVGSSKHEIQNHLCLSHRFKCLPYQNITFSLKALKKKKVKKHEFLKVVSDNITRHG